MAIRPGMLVKIKRGAIGVPSGSIGFVESISPVPQIECLSDLFHVRVYGDTHPHIIRRYYAADLEVYN